MEYQRPSIREIGSIRELTLQAFNKIGQDPDMFTAITAGIVVGSVLPAP